MQNKDAFISKLEKRMFKIERQRDELMQMSRSETVLILKENSELV